jgi:hypothetical protein
MGKIVPPRRLPTHPLIPNASLIEAAARSVDKTKSHECFDGEISLFSLFILSFDFYLLTGLTIVVDLFFAFFLQELVTWQVLLDLIVGYNGLLSWLRLLHGRGGGWLSNSRRGHRLLHRGGRWLLDRGGGCRVGRRWLPDDFTLSVDVDYLVTAVTANGDGIGSVFVPYNSRHIGRIGDMRLSDDGCLDCLRQCGELDIVRLGDKSSTNAGSEGQSYGSDFLHYLNSDALVVETIQNEGSGLALSHG